MSKFASFVNDIRNRFSGWRQPVYDPGYVYYPWKSWITGAAIVVFVALVAFSVINAKQGEGNTQAANTLNTTAQETVAQQQSPQQIDKEYYQVTKVVDGDTIDVSINGKVERLRLIGIDTPETVDPRKTIQCFGKEASDKAKSMLQGASVRLEPDASQDERDKYDRLLRYVYLEDGTNFNKFMISEGYAHEYTYQLPYMYQSEFKAAETDARENDRGLWSASTCNGVTTSEAPASSSVQSAPTPAVVGSNCDPNYSPCVPKVSYDLDCGDITSSVKVIGTDIHRFDRDGDGYGCESN